jgi:PII-like signaling protein
VNEDCLKLTSYFGELDRVHGGFVSDVLMDIFERRRFEVSLMLRGTEGFGLKHRLQTQRLLTLSEDLPLVSIAVDSRERIEAALDEVIAATGHGLLTLERARLLSGHIERVRLPEQLHEATKLTVYLGRQQRAGGKPAYVALLDLLHRRGIAGATVLLGVDGTAHGTRRRASFFGRTADLPVMVISVGDGERIAEALPGVGALLSRPLMTLERVRVLKRDGERLAEPPSLPASDPSGLAVWLKLMVYAGEQARVGGRPLHVVLIRRLREAGAASATALRGIWGYHGDHQPHGDRFWSLRRHVPVLTVLVDSPERMHRWWEIVDQLTPQTGLVTSEIVPAVRAAGPDLLEGGPRLAEKRQCQAG